MTSREELIRVEFVKFQTMLRISRWASIDLGLRTEGMAELSSNERDEVDLAAATGMVPFDNIESLEDPETAWFETDDDRAAPTARRSLYPRH
jgi:hypothetical protein